MVEKEKLLQDHIGRGNLEAAIELLFTLAVDSAKAGDFESAESMRSRIVALDPMAFREIVRLGEIIEEEKARKIEPTHRRTWSRLYEGLSVEEANALYFESRKAIYEIGETVFEQGEWKPRLYLLDSGRANITYCRDGGEFLLKTIEAGQFVGEDVFFSCAVCTTSMIARSRLEVRYLDAEVLNGWKCVHPVLESKLLGFVSCVESISELLKAREMDRRSMDRVNVGGKATVVLINLSGEPEVNTFVVDLCDISRGGMCFLGRFSESTAGRLLGNRLCISCSDPQNGPLQNFEQFGTIVGVQFHSFEDCTVNVKFDQFLSESLVELLGKSLPQRPGCDF